MSATVQQIAIGPEGVVDARATSGVERQIPPESLDLVDWNKAFLSLLEYKETKGLSNLLIKPGKLRNILQANPRLYRLEAEQTVVEPKNHNDRQRLQEAATNILRSYADALYRRRQAQWESKNLAYRQLEKSDENFRFNIGESDHTGRYIVRVPRGDEGLAREVEQLITDRNAVYQQDQGSLPRIHFDRHLYQPLLVEKDGITSSPPGLNKSERKFVADLRDYCRKASDALPAEAELFLLRNLTRGKGVGFFESSGFYPDFILWVKSGDQQRIVFIEPHGMRGAKAYKLDEKAKLHERLPELAQQIAERSDNLKVKLDSFIVSATPYNDLYLTYGKGTWSKEDFADKHILFPERSDEYDYLERILRS